MFDMFTEQAQEESQEETSSYSSSPVSSSDVYVVSIGGSLIVKAKPDMEKIKSIAETITSLHNAGKKIVIVVGGGKIARNYVEVLDSFDANNFEKDLMGIEITRANALLVANAIPDAHTEVLRDMTESKRILDSGKIPVFGGLMPFFTTDAVGALLAEYLGANFVNLTNVDGIYDADPADFPDAKRFEEIGYGTLISLITASGSKPGQNIVLDLACCLVLQRSKINGVVLDGNDMENFSSYINGLSFVGTTIRDIEDEEIVHHYDEDEEPKTKRSSMMKKKRKTSRKKQEDDSPPNPEDIDF